MSLNYDAGTDLAGARQGRVRLRSIADIDGRTRSARRAQNLVAQLEADLGGVSELSAAQRELVKRAAMLSAIVEDHEARWLENQTCDLSLYGTLTDRLRRTLEALGLERKTRDITQALVTRIRAGEL